MQDPIEKPTPKPKPPSRPRRTRKFVLPEHHHDERVDERAAEHIEAFLDGPVPPPRRSPMERRLRDPRPFQLDTRPDWMAAVRREGARHDRYGRPASVLLIEVEGCPSAAAVDRIAHRVADVIRAEARETDRAVRVAALGFRLLMPETGARAARIVAERLDRAFRATPDGALAGVELRIEIASARRIGSLEDALAEAEGRLSAAAGKAQAG